jgi:putative acetyltransferase
MNLIIRTESEEDYSQIKNINDNAFGQDNEGVLIEKLRKNKEWVNAISLVAETNDKLVGHILFFPIQIINNEMRHASLALAPMAVLPAYQNKGIGNELVNVGLELARDKGYKSVIVLGHRDYYSKFGFEMAKNWNIKAPFTFFVTRSFTEYA